MKILTLCNGSLEENCYVLSGGGGEAVVIDPGSSPDALKRGIAEAGLKPVLILATHAHFDHVGAVADLAEAYQAPFGLHPADKPMLDTLEDTFSFYGLGSTRQPGVDLELADGALIQKAGLSLKVLHTPGHTPGGVCFYHEASGSLFSGDTLFRRSVGRSDFEGGDARALGDNIRGKLFALPEGTTVYPGHGPSTTIGEEKRENDFLR